MRLSITIREGGGERGQALAWFLGHFNVENWDIPNHKQNKNKDKKIIIRNKK